jgi:hypothetical protein
MIRRLLIVCALVAMASPAAAHRLKLFATVDGHHVSGYAFFVGGARAQGTDWMARTADGEILAQGKTDAEGLYDFDLSSPVTDTITIVVDTHEGHIATASLSPERFGETGNSEKPSQVAETRATPPREISQTTGLQQQDLTELVEHAVHRQVAPLQEQIEAMDSRLRYSDIVSALCLILGLAGIGLYVRSLRK